MTLEILTSDALLPMRHGFFTRRGGASSGIFAGLNCGPGSTDQSESVRTNRARVADAMQVAPDALLTLHQTHSARVVTVTDPWSARERRPEADALVTDRPGLALAVLTADCKPVLLADAQAGVIGAAHAGWRGARAGILEATVDAMEALGARRARIAAVIGPCISQRAYEVDQDFLEEFLADDPQNARHFVNGADGRYQFDLPGYGLMRLRKAGVRDTGYTGHCTYADPARFYSYRRSVHAGEVDYGRQISVIRI